MKHPPVIILTLLCVLVFVPRANGCSCLRPEVPGAFKQAKAVFLGEVVDIVEPNTTDETAPLPGRFFTIKFKIQKSWKGIAFGTQEFSVLSAQGHYGCFAFPSVTKGETYLVYADPAYRAENWSVITICSRSTVLRFGSNPKLLDRDAIDPFSDMKQLDVIAKRVFSLDRARSRRRV
jgi:hypothetical protein